MNSYRSIHLRLCFLVAFVLVIACHRGSTQQRAAIQSSASKSRWILTWSDEFGGPDGSAPDATKWILESGGHGWGNNELEYYTPRRANVRQENGSLVIEAIKENFAGPEGLRNYTSARVKTEGRFSQQYGRFEARIQIPWAQGLWSAFWLLGDDFASTGWPACGEIDIMESVGSEPTTIQSNLHGPGYSGANSLTSAYTFPRTRSSEGFHIFAVEWEPQVVRFCVDGEPYSIKTPANIPGGKPWVFDHPFFILLNLAVGGNMPGSPDASTVFPQRMLVDYVRVYSRK